MITVPQSLNLKEIVEIGQTFHIISKQIGQRDLDVSINETKRLIDECDQESATYLI